MTLVIGLDTGGTYTDAALLDTATGTVRATGKSLTTRDDLSIGVGGAIRAFSRISTAARPISALSRCRQRLPPTPSSKVSADVSAFS
ncbi:MAG: hypothetical protein CM15mP115_19370 [Alphaproteobacteria bacterium]|nr:MAG: hypothetical protein CM15mP115_19370 [Alphaproteobacteria bacterium]